MCEKYKMFFNTYKIKKYSMRGFSFKSSKFVVVTAWHMPQQF